MDGLKKKVQKLCKFTKFSCNSGKILRHIASSDNGLERKDVYAGFPDASTGYGLQLLCTDDNGKTQGMSILVLADNKKRGMHYNKITAILVKF